MCEQRLGPSCVGNKMFSSKTQMAFVSRGGGANNGIEVVKKKHSGFQSKIQDQMKEG